MKSKLRRRLEQSVLHRAMVFAGRVCRRASPAALARMARVGAAIAMAATPRRQQLADANLAATFPELSPRECAAIRRASVRNMMRTMLETLRLPALTAPDLERLVETPDLTPMREAYQAGGGLILVSAHFGNWELMAAHLGHQIGPLTVVARDSSADPKLRLVEEARSSHGVTVINRRDTRVMLRLLGSGGALAMLPDQHAAEGGILMDFLGRPAWTFTGPALLAQRTGARVFEAFCVRTPDGRLRIELEPEIELVRSDDRAADIIENTRRINAPIERAIRRHPDNWLWLHDRWKQPRWREVPPDTPVYAGQTASQQE